MPKVVAFDKLTDADLTVEAEYEGGKAGNTADDPLGKLVPVGNQGGFRYSGSPKKGSLRLVVLYTSGADRDWPDAFDRETACSRISATTASLATSCTTLPAGQCDPADLLPSAPRKPARS